MCLHGNGEVEQRQLDRNRGIYIIGIYACIYIYKQMCISIYIYIYTYIYISIYIFIYLFTSMVTVKLRSVSLTDCSGA